MRNPSNQSRAGLDASSAQEFVASHLDPIALVEAALVKAGRAGGAMVVAEELRTHALPDSLPDDNPLVARYKALDEQTRWVEAQVGGAQGARQEAPREQLASLGVEFAHAVDELRVAHPEFDELVHMSPKTSRRCRTTSTLGWSSSSPSCSTIGSCCWCSDATARSRGEFPWTPLRCRNRAVDELPVSDLRGGDMYDAAGTHAAFDELGEMLLAPIAVDLKGASVVAADGPFREVPFGALRRNGHWLTEDLAVACVARVRSLDRRGSAEPAFRLDGPSLLLLGNPDGSLPGAEAEVSAIAAQFPGADT